MKQTPDGDFIASDGKVISADSDPRDLKKAFQEHSDLAEVYRVLADALRHGEDPTENSRYGFYQDAQGRWRDADHRELTDDGYEDPLVQAHRLAGHHQVLASDYREAAGHVRSARRNQGKAPAQRGGKAGARRGRERDLDEVISDSRREHGEDDRRRRDRRRDPEADDRRRPARSGSGRSPLVLIALVILLIVAVYLLATFLGVI